VGILLVFTRGHTGYDYDDNNQESNGEQHS
jgi:hypothetical protein